MYMYMYIPSETWNLLCEGIKSRPEDRGITSSSSDGLTGSVIVYMYMHVHAVCGAVFMYMYMLYVVQCSCTCCVQCIVPLTLRECRSGRDIVCCSRVPVPSPLRETAPDPQTQTAETCTHPNTCTEQLIPTCTCTSSTSSTSIYMYIYMNDNARQMYTLKATSDFQRKN